MNLRRQFHTFFALCFCLATTASANDTSDVFRKFEKRIVQVRILDGGSSTKSALGSGFFVGTEGEVVTNFHVVSQMVFHPEQYRVEITKFDNTQIAAKLVDVDVVHDLAILKTGAPPPDSFVLEDIPLSKGDRLYSVGDPLDLGFTIVEGTYNGLVEHSLYEKIHFTGALNPGMSGGPTLTQEGKIVGVNVSTAGNEVSFLVPEKFVSALFQHKKESSEAILEHVRTQLLDNQVRYVSDILKAQPTHVSLGHFTVPGAMSEAFHCWSEVMEPGRARFTSTSEQCSTEDPIFLTERIRTGAVRVKYTQATSQQLNRFQFSHAVEGLLKSFNNEFYGNEDQFTRFRCSQSFVEAPGGPLRTSLCLRAYKKFPDLYDAHLFFVTLSSDSESLGGDFAISGVSSENAMQLTKQFLAAILWNPS